MEKIFAFLHLRLFLHPNAFISEDIKKYFSVVFYDLRFTSDSHKLCKGLLCRDRGRQTDFAYRYQY